MKDILIVYEDLNNSDTSIHKSYINGFKSLGTNVLSLDTTVFLQKNRIVKRFIRYGLIYRLIGLINHIRVLSYGRINYHLVFIIKGSFIIKPTINYWVKNSHKGVCYFNPDDPFNLKTSNNLIRNNLTLYTIVYHWNMKQLNYLKTLLTCEVRYLDFGVDEFYFNQKLPHDHKHIYDSVFIGNGDQTRINFFRKLDIRLNEQNLNVELFGDNWPSDFKNIRINPKLNLAEMKKVLSKSLSAINILRDQNKDSTNMRTFEIPSLGCVLIHEKSEQAEKIFKNGEEMIFFNSQDELINGIKKLNQNITLCKFIREKAYVRSQQGNLTYKKKCEELMK